MPIGRIVIERNGCWVDIDCDGCDEVELEEAPELAAHLREEVGYEDDVLGWVPEGTKEWHHEKSPFLGGYVEDDLVIL